MKIINNKIADKRIKIIGNIAEKYNLVQDYTYDYGVCTPALFYEDHYVAQFGGYKVNHQHRCLVYVGFDEISDQEFQTIIENIPFHIQSITKMLSEEKMKREQKIKEYEKIQERKKSLLEKIKSFPGEKYSGQEGLMLQNGKLAYARKDFDFKKAATIEEWRWNSNAFLDSVQKILEP